MTDLLLIAVNAAIKAGDAILDIYTDPLSDFQIERKSDSSPLTIADKASNAVINQYLIPTNIPILSEEDKVLSFEVRKKWKDLWMIDPLDGTKEFIKKNGEFTVNIALVRNQNPILGVVFLPVKNILYFAMSGGGAFKLEQVALDAEFKDYNTLISGAQKLPCVTSPENEVKVVASRSHMSEETEDYVNKLKEKFEKVELVSVGSSIKICWVAEGLANIYPRFAPTMEWDTAAGHAVAVESGKMIYRVDEKTPLVYNKENLLNPWFIVK